MKAVVLFPGIRYSCDTPLLYFAMTTFRDLGYEVCCVDYDEKLQSNDDLPYARQLAGETVLQQLRQWPLSDCEDVVFLSKSIGTVLAGWAAEQLGLSVRQLYLTPLQDTLPYIRPTEDYVVGGGADPFLSAEKLEEAAQKQHFPLLMIPDVGHRLECRGDTQGSLAILSRIVELYHDFAR